MSKILDGKKLSVSVALKLARKIEKLAVKPKLVIIQIGDLDKSNTYIKNKKAFAEKIGAIAIHKKYPKTVKESRIISDITKSNRDASVHGIMVQLPAPKHFDIERVLETIGPKKDVDGLTSINTKHLFDNHEAFIPATVKGIICLLEEYKIKLTGTKIVIVGESILVGRPAMLALLNKGATITMCHKDTKELAKKIVGDVDYENVRKIVRAITPVPGGVGPMTVASLFQNLLRAYSLQT